MVVAPLDSSECAPGRTRTDTGRILSPLSLPLDYGGVAMVLKLRRQIYRPF